MESVLWRKQSIVDDLHLDCPGMGHIVLQNHQRTSLAFALLPGILPSCHCSVILFLQLFRYQLRISPDEESSNAKLRDGNFTHGYGYPWVSDPMGTGMGTKFYPWVIPVPDPRFGGYRHGYCLPPTGNPWISEIKLNSYLDQ
jgi:hypothetical protein